MVDKKNSEEFVESEVSEVAFGDGGVRDYPWLIGALSVVAVGIFLRFWQLALKPLHHDEGVNGHFLTRLFREGAYQYDPANYHGPDLYYLSLVFSKAFGLTTFSVRASVAVFGVLTIVLAFFLRRYIGRIGSLAAALLLALSPGMVYISRYFIHEILFVFFSFAIVVCILYFIENRRPGVGAVSAMTLLLLVCFLPTALNLAALAGDQNVWLLWSLRIALFLFESVLVFMIMRMLLIWREGRTIHLLLAAASAVMLFATKETAFITIGTMLIAAFCVWLWRKIEPKFRTKRFLLYTAAQFLALAGLAGVAFVYRHEVMETARWSREIFAVESGQPLLLYGVTAFIIIAAVSWLVFFIGIRKPDNAEFDSIAEPTGLSARTFFGNLGTGADRILLIAGCAFVFIYVGVLFFSSFFTYPKGVVGAFEAYLIWTKTGSADHTQNGYFAYLKWAYEIELPIFLLALLGTLIAIVKARHRFAIFAGLWAFGLFLAYTIIPYKTPWLALSFLLPMCIVAGYGINELAVSRRILQRVLALLLVVASAGILGFQTYDINFVRYDDEKMPYIYAHTRREFHDLIGKIEYYAQKSGKGKDATIEVVSPEYWPMPWYLNDYKNAVFGGQFVNANVQEMIVASQKQKDELNQRYGAHYKLAGEYPLRPGVELYLLVKKDLADADAQELYTLTE